MFNWLRKNDTGKLPERVQQAIREQQKVTEQLVSWFQLFVVLTLGSLYLAGPKPEVEFDIIPWALAIYLVLTLIRIVWSHRARLPDWSVAISSFFDIALLMALIWSFHLRYEQPPSFYLKAPTMLYVFIFIALRALRFEARFVVWTGLLASFGWGVLMLYVMYSDPGNMMVTRNYVEYLTSNAILIGAEFDKILAILLVTVIIAVALYRAKDLLIRAVSEQTAAQELSRFFAPEIAAKIKGAESGIRAGTGEMRQAAILNLDMRGFTAQAARSSPDEAMSLLADYQSRMVPLIREHGGSIDKFLGDGIMATFGAATPNDSYAADALRALVATVAAGKAWQTDCIAKGRLCPAVNGAVVSGPILFGAVGDETRLEYTVIGSAVNLSAKLEKLNKELGTMALCDRRTYDQAGAQGYEPQAEVRALPKMSVPDVEQQVDLMVLVE